LSWTDQSNHELGFRIERSLDNATFTEIVVVANEVSYTEAGWRVDDLLLLPARLQRGGFVRAVERSVREDEEQ
jgi:hypothetical protein